MTQRRKNTNTRRYNDRPGKIAYLEGSAARELREGVDVREVPRRKRLSNTARKNREKASHMNLGYMLFLSLAVAFAVMTLCSYIDLQSDITNRVDAISEMESRYNNLKLANDEEYNRISSSRDLEQIKAEFALPRIFSYWAIFFRHSLYSFSRARISRPISL